MRWDELACAEEIKIHGLTRQPQHNGLNSDGWGPVSKLLCKDHSPVLDHGRVVSCQKWPPYLACTLLGLQPPADTLGKHAGRGRAQHRVARLPGRGRRALQARQAQAEHAIHAHAVAAVQRIQLCLQVREAHLHSHGGADTARIGVYAKKALQCVQLLTAQSYLMHLHHVA